MSENLVIAIVTGLAAILGTSITPIIIELIRRKKVKLEDPVKQSIKTDALITDKLEEIKNRFDVNSIWLCQFHNGGYYPTGKSMQKFSMVYEISEGLNTFQQQFQNIPTGLFSKALNYLAHENIISIVNYENNENYGLEAFGEQTGSRSTYLFALITIDNKFIGFLGINFKDERVLNDVEKNFIEVEVTSIAGVLVKSTN